MLGLRAVEGIESPAPGGKCRVLLQVPAHVLAGNAHAHEIAVKGMQRPQVIADDGVLLGQVRVQPTGIERNEPVVVQIDGRVVNNKASRRSHYGHDLELAWLVLEAIRRLRFGGAVDLAAGRILLTIAREHQRDQEVRCEALRA